MLSPLLSVQILPIPPIPWKSTGNFLSNHANERRDRQTDKHGSKHYPATSVGGNYREVKVSQRVLYSLEECRRGAYLPSLGRRSRRWLYHIVCDTWPVRSRTYGYLPCCCTASLDRTHFRPADLEAALSRVSCHTPRRDSIRSPISVLTGLDVE